MSTSSQNLYKDYELGRFHGNLFAFLADKFPAEIRSNILENYFVVVDCTTTIRLLLKTGRLGYFMELSESKYTQIKAALNEVYKDIPKVDGYPDVYNSETMSSFNRRYPTVHNDENRSLVVWLPA